MKRWLFFGGVGYRANAVTFDGTNDFLTRGADLTGNADSKVGLFSGWFKFNGGNGTGLWIYETYIGASDTFYVARTPANIFEIGGRNTAGSTIMTLQTTGTYTSASGWVHLLAAWNGATGQKQIYITDASDITAGSSIANDSFDYTNSEHIVGRYRTVDNFLNADVADFYLNVAGTLDLSVEANRRKFISAAGKPVDLGADGSTPTGTAPIVFLSGATASWHTNKGAGGGFTENGALTDSPTSPSD